MAGIDVCTKKIFSVVPSRPVHASARRERAKEAVLMRIAAFMSQLKRRKSPYFKRTSVIVCLLMQD
ncbi:MAG: hypothetical protein WAM77_03900 [Xanthobacteraceae bacterium]|jgi:hypothetical protein